MKHPSGTLNSIKPKFSSNIHGSLHGLVTNVLGCEFSMSSSSYDYIDFWTNALEGHEFLYTPSYGLDSTATVLLHGWLWH